MLDGINTDSKFFIGWYCKKELCTGGLFNRLGLVQFARLYILPISPVPDSVLKYTSFFTGISKNPVFNIASTVRLLIFWPRMICITTLTTLIFAEISIVCVSLLPRLMAERFLKFANTLSPCLMTPKKSFTGMLVWFGLYTWIEKIISGCRLLLIRNFKPLNEY